MRSLVVIALVLAPLSLAYTPISVSQMQQIFPDAKTSTLETYTPYMNQAMEQYNINTPERQAAFLGQVGEETGQLNDLTEIGNADGTTYQGRGAIQLTGRANYAAASKAIGVNFVNNPSLVSEPQYAFQTAGWYWDANNLNKYADQGAAGFNSITKAVNGCVDCAVTHNNVRTDYYNQAMSVLNNPTTATEATTQPATEATTTTEGTTEGSTEDNAEEAFYSFPGLFRN